MTDKNECQIKENFGHRMTDPRQYNLTQDFIFIDQEFGSFFYKYIGKMNKLTAKKECSKFGNSVHLPIPRFAEENTFYQKHFGKKSFWLDISYQDSDSLKSAFGHSFTYQMRISTGPQGGTRWEFKDFNKYKWMKFNATKKFDNHEVIMTKTGQWMLIDENESIDSICVYNILPHQNCLTCTDKDFCRFNDKAKQTTECVCPDMKDGDFCEINICQTHCQNNGYCEYNDKTKAIDCLCEFPFYGEKCENKSEYTN